ncbi:hypothetical protein LGM58_20185 [Burkholderia contaminans]|uniref:hypothetical protein n=1 Tax=Burkholderia contaminans TaxID=488447 RepID=UPI001CF1403C|nr:hypothetical protein [Burkholderia contaminans]MCA7885505.1 hypothetical protein [Burkholderia contaminans]
MHDHALTERTAARGYKVQTLTAYVGALGFSINLACAAVELYDGHFAGLLARVGVAAFTAAVWFSGSFRANLMRQRVTEGRPTELLRRPSDWLPPFTFEQVRLGDERVQLLPPDQR